MTYIQQQLSVLHPTKVQYKVTLQLRSEFGKTNHFSISLEALKEIEAILEKEYES